MLIFLSIIYDSHCFSGSFLRLGLFLRRGQNNGEPDDHWENDVFGQENLGYPTLRQKRIVQKVWWVPVEPFFGWFGRNSLQFAAAIWLSVSATAVKCKDPIL